MNVLTEGRHTAEYLVEEMGQISREAITIAAGADLVPGTVLGRIALGEASVEADAGNTGDGTVAMDATTPLLAHAMAGDYRVVMTAATAFTVFAPNGANLGDGAAGTAFENQVKFTFTAGGEAMVAGDAFTITVAQGSGKYTALDLSALNGAQTAAGVLFGHARALETDVAAVAHVRLCEINGQEITWPEGITAAQKAAATAQLEAVNIIVR